MIHHSGACYCLLVSALWITCSFQLVFELKIIMTQKIREYDRFTFAALDKTLAATEMFPRSGQKAALDSVRSRHLVTHRQEPCQSYLQAVAHEWDLSYSQSVRVPRGPCYIWKVEPTFYPWLGLYPCFDKAKCRQSDWSYGTWISE